MGEPTIQDLPKSEYTTQVLNDHPYHRQSSPQPSTSGSSSNSRWQRYTDMDTVNKNDWNTVWDEGHAWSACWSYLGVVGKIDRKILNNLQLVYNFFSLSLLLYVVDFFFFFYYVYNKISKIWCFIFYYVFFLWTW